MKIHLTQEDMAKGQPIPNGWYKVIVTDLSIKPATKDPNSTNYIPTFTLENDPQNRTAIVYFNSKGLGYMKPFLAALAGVPLAKFVEDNKKGIEFDFDQCKGGKLQIQIENELQADGSYRSQVKNYAPYNFVIPQPPF